MTATARLEASDGSAWMSRRTFARLSAQVGLKVALGAWAAGRWDAPALADGLARDAQARRRASYHIRFGASIINERNEETFRTGVLELARRIEALTAGEVYVQLIGSGGACTETSCGEKVANGVLDMGCSSTQNLGNVFPYISALDFPFLWADRQSFLNLFCAPEMNFVFRDALRRLYDIEPLFMSGDMRDIMLGRRWAGLPEVRRPAQLAGVKLRITNSEPIRCFASALGMSPVPLAWTELLDGLRTGTVDGTETWPSAAAGEGLTRALGQGVALGFAPGSVLAFAARRPFDALPARVRERIWQAAREAMVAAEAAMAEARSRALGVAPWDGGLYRAHGVRVVRPDEGERADFAVLGAADGRNAAIYDDVRRRLDRLAGFDVYGALADFARHSARGPFRPGRWWV